MSAAIAVTPASGSITHGATVCRFDVTGAAANDSSAYDRTKYPSDPEVSYYIKFVVSAAEKARSYVFAPNPDGTHSFNSFMFPSAGTWTVTLNKTSDNSTAATLSVVVS